MGNTYTDTTIDIGSGTGNNGTCIPRTPAFSSSGNRHCTAHEQIDPAINLICDALEQLGYANTAPIRKLTAESIMPKNTGE